ncbi:MAG: metallophosphoesterase [Terriglobia bacterium]|jgi:predicted MPP superfamily phosphohydrolase
MSRGLVVIPVFILIALSILFLAHYFLYYSLVHFFGIAAPPRRTVLAVVLLLLPVSFIASSFLSHWTDNLFSRAFYFCSSLWLGVGLTLITAFALAWAAWGATRIFVHSPGPAWFGLAAVALACLYSAYGVWNAYHPRTENLTVHIKNLPPTWRGRKLVQLSDLHLGHILGASFLARLVAMANAENPDVVFITGDLFDGADGHLEELVAPLNGLRAPLGIYFVTGNHETFLGVERAYAALRTTPARILADERVMIDGLQVIGISYPERGHSKDFAQVIARLPGFDPTLPSILLYHSPAHIAEAKAAGISLQLSGHAHHGQIFPIQFISRLIYGRYYYGLHVEGDYTLYASSGAGTWGPTMRTGNHPEIAVIHLK